MNFKLGLCSISFRNHTSEEIIKNMKEVGLSYIEWGSDIHAPIEKTQEIALLQKENDIICCSYGTYFVLGVTPLNELEKYIEAARTLETNILRLWCGNKNSENYTEAEKTELFEECKCAAKIAEKSNVILCMECHNNTYTNTKESSLELMKAINNICFKMYWQPNQFKSENENYEYAKLLAEYVVNIHIFNWDEQNRYPLCEAQNTWKRYLTCFDKNQVLLLEFMPDNRIESLKAEAKALKEIIQ